jgi:phage terminase Nu1 subunit (DNA packaging protein)
MILNGWKEIASYLRSSVRTVQRWEKIGMPVIRPVEGNHGSVIAYSEQLDSWLKRTDCGAPRHSAPRPDHSNQMLHALIQAQALVQEIRETRMQMGHCITGLKAELSSLKENVTRIKTAGNQFLGSGSLPPGPVDLELLPPARPPRQA